MARNGDFTKKDIIPIIAMKPESLSDYYIEDNKTDKFFDSKQLQVITEPSTKISR